MKNLKNKLGFTLIELLVVITIIGILATGAVSVYTSQIQKARDSNRITSLKALQGGFEQAYSDMSEYPGLVTSAATCDPTLSTSTFGVMCLITLGYMPELPEDTKSGNTGAGAALDFVYNVSDDSNNVTNQWFEVSVGFEAQASVNSKAKNNGSDVLRFEAGNATKDVNTIATAAITAANCAAIPATGGNPNGIVIKGDC